MPRYVLLHHDCSPSYRDGSHWDLMFEHDGALRTWSLLELPMSWGGEASHEQVIAHRLADHRLAYLEFEGPVSRDRGHVSRVASGEFDWLVQSDAELAVEFLAGQLKGSIRLKQQGSGDEWLLTVS